MREMLLKSSPVDVPCLLSLAPLDAGTRPRRIRTLGVYPRAHVLRTGACTCTCLASSPAEDVLLVLLIVSIRICSASTLAHLHN